MVEGHKFRYEVAVIGDSQVGKTCLIMKFAKGDFTKRYDNTLGVQLSRFDLRIGNDDVRLIFWDINAGKAFQFLRPTFYKNKNAAIIVFSLEDTELGKKSFINILKWQKEVFKNRGEIPMYIFANKVDLVKVDKLNEIRIKKMAEENNFRGYYLTSAVTGGEVVTAFGEICRDLYQDSIQKARAQENI
ncbi:MAG: Rab family GTPase [Promethearchaeota archaeon]